MPENVLFPVTTKCAFRCFAGAIHELPLLLCLKDRYKVQMIEPVTHYQPGQAG